MADEPVTSQSRATGPVYHLCKCCTAHGGGDRMLPEPVTCPECGQLCSCEGCAADAWLADAHPPDYDSRPDTYKHIGEVRSRLLAVAHDLIERAHVHDASKLESPEVEVFNEFTPKLRDSTYGSDEYRDFLAAMGEGLAHHYAHNRHHPEFFENGVAGMNLLDVIEMLADWKAATLRHADGDLARSIEQNAERFGYGDEFKALLLNTARDMGWL